MAVQFVRRVRGLEHFELTARVRPQVVRRVGEQHRPWGADRDQVLTEAFDYIRSTNLRDPQTGATPFAPRGQVVPIVIGDTKGFGRFHTLSQFGFHFICSQDGKDGIFKGTNGELPAGTRAIEAAFLMEPYSPSLGWYKLEEEMFFEVSFGKVTVDGQDLKFPATASASLNNMIGSGWHNNGRERGGAGGLRGPVQAFGGAGYRFVSKAAPRVNVSTQNGKKTMTFAAGPITVKVYAGGSASAANLVQTFTLNFPGGVAGGECPPVVLVRCDTTGAVVGGAR